ncbi:hypothetical protein SNEBB_004144 [Seison nebaliae]|nr:hypothetical protein SNEBB_004144 [Seison nebaliae]
MSNRQQGKEYRGYKASKTRQHVSTASRSKSRVQKNSQRNGMRAEDRSEKFSITEREKHVPPPIDASPVFPSALRNSSVIDGLLDDHMGRQDGGINHVRMSMDTNKGEERRSLYEVMHRPPTPAARSQENNKTI